MPFGTAATTPPFPSDTTEPTPTPNIEKMSATPFPMDAFASLADNQPIACVEGVLTKLYGPKDGTNSNGPWSIQNAELDCKGVIVPVMFKDREPIDQSLKNRTIRLTASTAKGMSGLYAIDDVRNGATTRKLKVTPSAQLDIIDTGRAAEPPRQQAVQTPPQQAAGQPTGQQQASQPAPKDDGHHDLVRAAKQTIIQILNLHLLVAKAVEKMEAPAFKKATGLDMSESQRQAATASIFITCERQGLVRNMPTTLIDD